MSATAVPSKLRAEEERLAAQWIGFAVVVARKRVRKIPGTHDPDAVVSAAGFGLLRAIREFLHDPKGLPLKAFIVKRVQWTLAADKRVERAAARKRARYVETGGVPPAPVRPKSVEERERFSPADLATLPPSLAAVGRLYFVERLPIKEVAGRRGVVFATAVNQIAAVRRRIGGAW